jgi:large subunit ribosomal protein L6
MSRVGKNPINIPAGTTVKLTGQGLSISGKSSSIDFIVDPLVKVQLQDNVVLLEPADTSDRAKTLWGTYRSLLNNAIQGASEGFTRTLDINGVGYRAAVEGKDLVLQLGYSHPIRYPIPEGIQMSCPKPTQIIVKGSSKQRVGQIASEIRSFRGPEPYKGKGIKYENEKILRKEGKKK